jgi:hypothetical protein
VPRQPIDIEVRGANRVANKFRTAAAQFPARTDAAVGSWARKTAKRLKGTPYPPKPAGSTYRRTGRLANKWRAEKQKDGVWDIINDAKSPRGVFYADYVVGEEQAWMHEGRWWQAHTEIRKYLPELREEIIEATTGDFD